MRSERDAMMIDEADEGLVGAAVLEPPGAASVVVAVEFVVVVIALYKEKKNTHNETLIYMYRNKNVNHCFSTSEFVSTSISWSACRHNRTPFPYSIVNQFVLRETNRDLKILYHWQK